MSTAKPHSIAKFLFSLAGLVVMAVLLILLNLLASNVNLRKDLTEDQLYTLSPGSRKILSELKGKVVLRFYYSRDAEDVPVYIKPFAKRVEDYLREYEVAGRGKLRVERLNPTPDSDAEDSANLDGVQGQQLPNGDPFYLGISVRCLDQHVAIPFLSPAEADNLEYNLTRAIFQVTHPEKPKLGIMSSLPVFGEQPNPMMMMRQQRNQGPWMLVTELKRDYSVQEVPVTSDAIPEEITTLLLIHPKDLTETTLYAIDQFVLRGGKLIAMIDPFCRFEAATNPMNPMQPQAPTPSTLGPLLTAWGITFDTEKVLADKEFPTQMGGRDPRDPGETWLTVLSMDKRAVNAQDPVTGAFDRLILADVGVFTGDPAAGLTKSWLLRSSAQSQLVDKAMVQFGSAGLAKTFKASGQQYDLAIRLVGRFPSAFVKGPPAPAPTAEEEPPASQDAGGHLAEAKAESAVILIGDADMMFDDFWVRRMNLMGQQVASVTAENFYLLQNAVEQLGGDTSLISIRARGVTNRPFEVVRERQRQAEEQYQAKIQQLEDEVAEVQRRINELQRTRKDGSQQVILSPEQQAELANFREKQKTVSQELKQVRKYLRQDIDELKTRLTWLNIALVPVLIMHFGLILWLFRRRRTTAQLAVKREG